VSTEEPSADGNYAHFRFAYTPAATSGDGKPPRRPYLWLDVQGPNKQRERIRGIVDSGADNSVLPDEYIRVFGYTPETLSPCNIQQVEGSCEGHRALVPCTATIVKAEAVEFELQPLFMSTDIPLWGRHDFLAVFHLVVEQRHERFDLVHDF
jgi:hypothetical protein